MSRTKTPCFCVATAAFLLGWLVGVPASFGYDGPWPKIFDYTSSPDHYGDPVSPGQDELGFQPDHPEITPVPRPGAYTLWNNSRDLALYDQVIQQNRPLAVNLTTPYTHPLTGTEDPQALSKTIDYLSSKNYRLDYLWMEFEPVRTTALNAEVAEAVRQVRASTDPQIKNARAGAYDYYPCGAMAWMPYPGQNNSTAIANVNYAYNSTGVNVAMPSIYPYEYYEKHTYVSTWGNNVAPNKRSALFWAPLEKFSNVKANLPAGHEIIPYINDFCPYEGFDAPQPTHEDNAALLKHIRLRGSDGYYLWRTNSENEAQPYDNEEYRGDMGAAWTSLDWLFAGSQPPTILNMLTSKTTGLQWSGAVTDRGVAVLVSNLGNSTAYFTMPDAGEFNNQLIDGFSIAPGEHRLETFQVLVPEPAMMTLLLSGAIVWLLRRRRTSGPMRLSWPISRRGAIEYQSLQNP